MATAAAIRPESLDTTPPPRNVGIPDTSINVGDGGQLPAQSQPPQSAKSYMPLVDISEPEGVAQEPRPTSSEISSTNNTTKPSIDTEKPTRKSKLRPRKAAMKLSDKAIVQLRDLLNQPDPKLIRVGVKNRGCSGLAYHLEYVDKAGIFDEAVEQEGVKVLIDSKALFSIIGSEMDWVEDKLSARFVFRNPNISESPSRKTILRLALITSSAEQCGCGESFSVS